MATIDIKNNEIDSGNWVNMKSVSFVPSYSKSNEAKPLNGLSSSSLPEGDRIGISPTSITIQGFINVDDFDSTAELWSETPSTLSSTAEDGTSNSGVVTLGYLNALWRNLNGETQIRIYIGEPGSQKQWKNWDNTSTTLYVVIDSIDPAPDMSSDGLHFINYTIVCREVQADGTYTT